MHPDSEHEWPSSQTLLPKQQGFKVGFPRPLGEGEGIQSVHAQIQQCPLCQCLSCAGVYPVPVSILGGQR
jgi:hypothetical protein